MWVRVVASKGCGEQNKGRYECAGEGNVVVGERERNVELEEFTA